MTELQQRLYDAVSAAKWRGEASLCRQFDKRWKGHCASEARSEPVEDALYQLVRRGKLEWFGDNLKALKYRARRTR